MSSLSRYVGGLGGRPLFQGCFSPGLVETCFGGGVLPLVDERSSFLGDLREAILGGVDCFAQIRRCLEFRGARAKGPSGASWEARIFPSCRASMRPSSNSRTSTFRPA